MDSQKTYGIQYLVVEVIKTQIRVSIKNKQNKQMSDMIIQYLQILQACIKLSAYELIART